MKYVLRKSASSPTTTKSFARLHWRYLPAFRKNVTAAAVDENSLLAYVKIKTADVTRMQVKNFNIPITWCKFTIRYRTARVSAHTTTTDDARRTWRHARSGGKTQKHITAMLTTQYNKNANGDTWTISIAMETDFTQIAPQLMTNKPTRKCAL